MLKELQNSKKIVGLKQVRRAVEENKAKKVFLAKDASPDIYDKVVDLCKAKNIEIIFADSKKQLGNACKIDVSAAVAAIII